MATMTLDQLQTLVEQQGAQLAALQEAAAAETPLPTEYYTLSQTGETVDAAIRRAMAGGAIDIALAGKAPSGYGLGTSAPQFADNDANNVTGSGWNSVNSTTANRPTGVTWGCIRTDYYYSGAIWQTYYQMSSTCRAVRYFASGAWSDWEWDNPPMAKDTEYKLTKRYGGKPVYTKLLNSGTMPANGSYKDVVFAGDTTTANNYRCISASGTVGVLSYSGGWNATYPGASTFDLTGLRNAVRVTAHVDFSTVSGTVDILVEYIKTTD